MSKILDFGPLSIKVLEGRDRDGNRTLTGVLTGVVDELDYDGGVMEQMAVALLPALLQMVGKLSEYVVASPGPFRAESFDQANVNLTGEGCFDLPALVTPRAEGGRNVISRWRPQEPVLFDRPVYLWLLCDDRPVPPVILTTKGPWS